MSLTKYYSRALMGGDPLTEEGVQAEIKQEFRNPDGGIAHYSTRVKIREHFIHRIGYFLFDERFITTLQSLQGSGVWWDLGCGTGALTHYLNSFGITARGVDNYSLGEKNEYGQNCGMWIGPQTYTRRDMRQGFPRSWQADTKGVILSWPHDNWWYAELLDSLECGKYVVMIGEEPGGCCLPYLYQHLFEREFTLVTQYSPNEFPGISDTVVQVWRKGWWSEKQVVITFNPYAPEYRIPHPRECGGFDYEVGAYYTDSEEDAIDTARCMYSDNISVLIKHLDEDDDDEEITF